MLNISIAIYLILNQIVQKKLMQSFYFELKHLIIWEVDIRYFPHTNESFFVLLIFIFCSSKFLLQILPQNIMNMFDKLWAKLLFIIHMISDQILHNVRKQFILHGVSAILNSINIRLQYSMHISVGKNCYSSGKLIRNVEHKRP